MLIDQRSKEDYEKEHLKGAFNIELDELLELARHDLLKSKCIYIDTPLYIYCYGGVCAKKSVETLVKMGYNATNIGSYENLKELNTYDE